MNKTQTAAVVREIQEAVKAKNQANYTAEYAKTKKQVSRDPAIIALTKPMKAFEKKFGGIFGRYGEESTDKAIKQLVNEIVSNDLTKRGIQEERYLSSSTEAKIEREVTLSDLKNEGIDEMITRITAKYTK